MSNADDEIDRKAILARRRRFMAVALTGLAGTTITASACPCPKVAPPDEPEPSPPPSTDADSEGEHQDDGDPPEQAQPGE